MNKRIGYMFAGQGSQTPGMGQDLYQHSQAARQVFQQADATLQRPLAQLCFTGTAADLTASANCQPAITATSLACLAAWQERTSLKPTICGGLSLGEYAALQAAGTLAFADALRLVADRGKLMDQACQKSEGGMAAVLNGDPEMIQQVCTEFDIDIANYNCPGQIVISGDLRGVQKAMAKLSAAELRVVQLSVAGAYHSRLMAPAAVAFRPLLQSCPLASPVCAIVQNVTGQVESCVGRIRDNLASQITDSVRWEACARVMMSSCDVLLEFGPGSVLTGFIRRMDRQFPCASIQSMSSLEQALAIVNK